MIRISPPSSDSTKRFSNRVADYVRYRPDYPRGILAILEAETGLSADSRIADVGSGTGISAELFLAHGNVVDAVEPNADMRAAAEATLAQYPRFHSVVGTAEATTLADNSVDYVVAAQAFHWLDAQATRREFARILRADGWVVLIWNTRRVDATPFLRAYEVLLQKFATDYRQVDHRNIDQEKLQSFYAAGRSSGACWRTNKTSIWPGYRGGSARRAIRQLPATRVTNR